MPIEILDIILIGMMLLSGLLAMIRGFSREVLSISSWAVAGIAAFLFYKTLAPTVAGFMKSLTENELAINIVSGGIIFVIVLIIVSIITLKIADFIVDSRVGALDRTLGFLFGAVRGFLLIMVMVLFAEFLFSESMPNWITNAKSKPLISSVGERLIDSIPEDPWDTIRKKLGVGDDEQAEGQDA